MSKKSIKELRALHSKIPDSKTSWKEFEVGGGTVLDTGNSELYSTGNWVPKKLCFNKENCINCGLCWPICPDDAIILDEKGNMTGVDLDHCKDCGMCVEVCPANKAPDKTKHALYFKEDYRDDF